MRMTVRELKDRLINGEISSYSWMPTERMWADVLTKEMRLADSFEKVLLENEMDLPGTNVNKVKAVKGEVRMENIQNQSVSLEEE